VKKQRTAELMNISKLLTALLLHTGDEAILEYFIWTNLNKASSITKPKYIFISLSQMLLV